MALTKTLSQLRQELESDDPTVSTFSIKCKQCQTGFSAHDFKMSQFEPKLTELEKMMLHHLEDNKETHAEMLEEWLKEYEAAHIKSVAAVNKYIEKNKKENEILLTLLRTAEAVNEIEQELDGNCNCPGCRFEREKAAEKITEDKIVSSDSDSDTEEETEATCICGIEHNRF